MQPYGKSQLFVYSCKCCQENVSPRAQAKQELRKLLEEAYDEVSLNDYHITKRAMFFKCGVCGQEDDPNCVEEC